MDPHGLCSGMGASDVNLGGVGLAAPSDADAPELDLRAVASVRQNRAARCDAVQLSSPSSYSHSTGKTAGRPPAVSPWTTDRVQFSREKP